MIICGDCIEEMKKLDDNSVDSIVTDPPYGLSFMGKKWDYDVPTVEVWKEAFRVLKPGGMLLSFAGTRTQHRMCVNIEDAGFEIKDLIFWCYGQGFPKSTRIGCNCDRGTLQYSNETLSLSSNKDLSGMQQGISMPEQISSSKKQDLLKKVRGSFDIKEQKGDTQEATSDMQALQEGVLPKESSEGKSSILLSKMQRDSEVGTSKEILGERIGEEMPRQGTENGKEPSVERGSNLLEEEGELQVDKICEMSERVSGNGEEGQLHNGTSLSDGSTSKKTIDENGSSTSHKSRSPRQSDRESDAIPEQHTSQNIRRICETCGGVIGAEGFGSALKPSLEPITMAKKPISEKNMRLNVLKWGTGGINIDGCRVEATSDVSGWSKTGSKESENVSMSGKNYNREPKPDNPQGRFPANLIHDGSDEVVSGFPETKSGKMKAGQKRNSKPLFGSENDTIKETIGDSGSAARFFYCAKSSRKDRNDGLDSYVTVKYNRDTTNKSVCKEENMVAVQLLKRDIYDTETVNFSIDESGVNIMAQCHKDSLSTILTETRRIIESKIYNSLMLSLTNESTQDVNLEKENGGNLAESVANLRRSLLTITKGEMELALGASRVVLKMLSLISEEENWKQASNFHSTVKPTALMQYLVRLVTPLNGTVLDPFMGSGSTGKACVLEGFDFIGIDMDQEYCDIAKARIENVVKNKEEEPTLFSCND